jgi:hypothetical protein
LKTSVWWLSSLCALRTWAQEHGTFEFIDGMFTDGNTEANGPYTVSLPALADRRLSDSSRSQKDANHVDGRE